MNKKKIFKEIQKSSIENLLPEHVHESELAKYIGLEEAPKSWNIAFEKIKDNIPKKIKWLDKKYSNEVLNYYKLDDINFRKKYIETIDMLNSNVYLKVLCYLWHYILYIDNSGLYKDVWSWKETKDLFLKKLEII